ncbi:hypothetical protein LCGC14_0752880 [marine sediment metagenome]|uniref:Uncharacterized protein n=1 Tax=marine sediment metagenome TaxID=412755 RepID=A0A0F9Q7N7_9ZZZZ
MFCINRYRRSGQTSISIHRWFVKGCKRWFRVTAHYGPYEPSEQVGLFYKRQPAVHVRPSNPCVAKVIRPVGCPPDSSRGRHWKRRVL